MKTLGELSHGKTVKSSASGALEAIKAGAFYSLYEGVTERNIEIIHAIIADSFLKNRLSLNAVVEAIVEKTGLDEARAEVIAWTETAAVANTARALDWRRMEEERGEKFIYRWSVHHDNRTSEICKEIEQRVGAGKPLDELQAIIKEVSQKHIPDWTGWEHFVAHPNERSTVVRVV